MWSSNLFLASLQNLNREKRERQPNWTESEKQLLLCLTEMHKSVLENKGSDTMTIKRKSEAWDEIALRMKAAGFNRSKERLKQQLGRIRAAEAKKIKDSMGMYLNDNQIEHSSNFACSSPPPLPLQEHQYIKSENTPPPHVNVCIDREIKVNSNIFKPNFKSYSIVNNVGKENKNIENSKILYNGMHFKLHSVQSLAKTNKNVATEAKIDDCFNEEKSICAADVTSSISCSNVHLNINPPTSFESNQNNNYGNNEDAASSPIAEKSQMQQRKKRNIRPRYKRSSFNREQNLQELYRYRIAFERERLHNLKLQQKRDRILYRKDVEIQNLKLQILKNLKNQQCDSNSYTF